MKQLRIDFVQDRRWVWIWGLTAVVCLAILSMTAWKWHKTRQSIHATEARIAVLRQELAARERPKVIVDPQEESIRKATRLLNQDLNAAFTAVERLSEPNVRLKSFNLDNVGGVLRVEYELDSMVRASSVTFALNAGYETRPWILESVSGLGSAGTSQNGPTAQLGRGVWSVQLGKL